MIPALAEGLKGEVRVTGSGGTGRAEFEIGFESEGQVEADTDFLHLRVGVGSDKLSSLSNVLIRQHRWTLQLCGHPLGWCWL